MLQSRQSARKFVKNPRIWGEIGGFERKNAKKPREEHTGMHHSRGSMTDYRRKGYFRNLMQHQLSMESWLT